MKNYYYQINIRGEEEGMEIKSYKEALNQFNKNVHDLRNWMYCVNKGKTLQLTKEVETEDGNFLTIVKKEVIL